MFTAEDIQQARVKGRQTDPTTISTVNLVKNNQTRIRKDFESANFKIGGDHILNQIVSSIAFSTYPNYDDLFWICRRSVNNIANTLRVASYSYPGKIHNGRFIEKQDELIVLVAKPINPKVFWKDYQPVKYLSHEYTNINWGFGNGKPRGLSIIEINIVELLWQYVKGMQYYESYGNPIDRLVFLWRHALCRMQPTYMDCAIFNHYLYIHKQIPLEREEPIGWIRTPYIARNVDGAGLSALKHISTTDLTPAAVLNNLPMYFKTVGDLDFAVELISLKDEFVTWQNWWPYFLSNLKLASFTLSFEKPAMEKYHDPLLRELRVFEDQNILQRLDAGHKDYIRQAYINPIKELTAK